MVGQEILFEIDATLDQLIQNAEALQRANIQDLSEMEIEAFQKTQESLVHHLLHMDERLSEKNRGLKVLESRSVQAHSKGRVCRQIQEKLGRFEKLDSDCSRTIAKSPRSCVPILLKRRSKRLIKSSSL